MKKILITIYLITASLAVIAKPAYPGPIKCVAEDGTEKTIYLHGDENFHYTTDAAGQWLDEKTLQPMSQEAKEARLNAAIAHKAARRAPRQEMTMGDKPNLAPRGLIILANFTDVKFTTPKATIDSMHNGRNYKRSYKIGNSTINAEGSVWKYFYDQSYGQYSPTFDVVGPVELSHDMAYYGKNNSWGDDKNATAMIREACQLAYSNYNVDFSLYDANGDNTLELVYVMYAGYGEADGGPAESIWPHQSNTSFSAGGNYYSAYYACGNEISSSSNQYDGIGTFCHEFGHVLGLPDFYVTPGGKQTNHTLLSWDIMDSGCYNNDGNTPPAYSAYERFFMGWLTPQILKDPNSIWLGKLNEDQTALLMCEGDEHNLDGFNPEPQLFYLIENRPKTGWDKFQKKGGMLITRINYNKDAWMSNTVNNGSEMFVDIMEAKENETYGEDLKAKTTDVYPNGSTEFTKFEGHEIRDIVLDEYGSISFGYRGAPRTPIENVQSSDAQCTKVLRNGQVIIVRGEAEYDLMGRKLQ